MKAYILLTTLLGLTLAAPTGRSLLTEFLDFAQVIPVREIIDITHNHLDNDPEFGAAIKYIQSPEWQELGNRVEQTPEYQDLKNYLVKIGVPFDFMNKFVGNMIQRANPKVVGDKLSFEPFITDIEAIIPFEKIMSIVNDKLQNSETFKELYDALASKEMFKIVEKLRALPDVKLMTNQLIKMGVKVNEYLEFIYSFLNWGSPL